MIDPGGPEPSATEEEPAAPDSSLAPGDGSSPPPDRPPSRYGAQARGLLDPAIVVPAAGAAFKKLDPRAQLHNPVMFVVLVGTAVTLAEAAAHPSVFAWAVTAFLFLTVVFANFAEAMAEGRGKAQAASLRRMRTTTEARRLEGGTGAGCPPRRSAAMTWSYASRGMLYRPTARWWRGWRRSTSRPSPASPPL